MEKAVSGAKEDFATVRTGRASPLMFSKIVVDYYGSATPLIQLASVSVPEARMAVIKPYDPSQLRPMEKAIRDSDLGVNPTNDGMIIRVPILQLSQERRRHLVKVSHTKGEEAKVSLPNLRRRATEQLRRSAHDGQPRPADVPRRAHDPAPCTHRYPVPPPPRPVGIPFDSA